VPLPFVRRMQIIRNRYPAEQPDRAARMALNEHEKARLTEHPLRTEIPARELVTATFDRRDRRSGWPGPYVGPAPTQVRVSALASTLAHGR
jgi:hypothetical protein